MDYKRCWAAVDLAALSHNYHCIRRFLSPGCRYLAIVKDDGYGHGAATVAGQLQKDGADWFGVATMEEALDLRRQGIYRPILVLGYTDPAAAPILASNTITQTLFSEEYALQLAAEAAKAGCVVDCHVKVDTGMSRLGFYFQDIERDKEAVSVVAEACPRPGLIPEGIFTHFAVADGGENGKAFTLKQFSCFMALIAELEKQGITFKIHHCANSGAILDYPEMHLDMVRAGVILYGMEPSLSVEHHADFRPVLSLHSVISHVKEIEPGSDISYDRTFTAKERMRVATIPVGYADGYSRRLSNRGSVLIHGTRCPILGKVCMDQCMVDVSAVPQAKVGDTVTLIGRDGEDEITAAEIAGIMETIHYEVVCDISKRVTRVYLKNGKEVSVLDCILDKY